MSFELPSRELGVFALESARIAGLLAASPLPWQMAPIRVRGALCLLLAFVVHGAAPASGIESLEALARAIPFEVLLGVAMGLVVRFALATIEIAGEIISPLSGLGAAALFDAHLAESETGITRFLRTGAMLIALVAGLHRTVLGAVLASFRVLPAGAALHVELAAPALLEASSTAIASGVRIALPVVSVLLLLQVALAFVSRAAPAMQVFSIGFAASLVAGGVTLAATLPDFGHEVEAEMSHVGRRLEIVVTAVAGE